MNFSNVYDVALMCIPLVVCFDFEDEAITVLQL